MQAAFILAAQYGHTGIVKYVRRFLAACSSHQFVSQFAYTLWHSAQAHKYINAHTDTHKHISGKATLYSSLEQHTHTRLPVLPCPFLDPDLLAHIIAMRMDNCLHAAVAVSFPMRCWMLHRCVNKSFQNAVNMP
jgi:hypothetical protein